MKKNHLDGTVDIDGSEGTSAGDRTAPAQTIFGNNFDTFIRRPHKRHNGRVAVFFLTKRH